MIGGFRCSKAKHSIGEPFTFGPGITDGIKNLTVAANQSTETAQRLTYQFDDQFYQRT
jgi:hypothetical protein